jgi:hypothetical protein
MDRKTRPPFPVEDLSRPLAIDRVRRVLAALQSEERCACAIASRYGIFCRGFEELSDAEFRQRIFWISRTRPQATREELEALVSQYHLGKQQATGAAVCCDVETREHCACDGWNTFDNKTLEEQCLKLTGRPVRIGERRRQETISSPPHVAS